MNGTAMIQWYYRDPQSRKIGPLSSEEFQECVAQGEVRGSTKVWRSGLADWTTYAALLAHEATAAIASAPATGAAPQSSSYSTFVALGASATHQRPSSSGIATSASTPHSSPAPTFEKCPNCDEGMPQHLFRESGSRRVCGSCLRNVELKAERDKLRDAKGVDANWLGKHILRVGIGALVVAAIRMLFMEFGGGHHESISTVPAPEEFGSSSGPPIVHVASTKR